MIQQYIDNNPEKIFIIIGILVATGCYQLIRAYKPQWLERVTQKTNTAGNTPLLNSVSTDFTHNMASRDPDPVVGRDEEIIRLAQILARRNKNNAILVGPPGVGKTAIVEGLAQRIVQGKVPGTLLNKRVLSLDITALLSDTKYRGEFEKRAKQLVQEIRSANRSIILFIDEMHSLIQSQGSQGSLNFSDILKPALARGDLQVVGATTIREYDLYITADSAFERRFQPVYVDEPTIEQAISILQGLKEKYGHYHKVSFTDAALRAAVSLTHKHITGRTLPDKAIDAIDEAASLVRVSHLKDAVHIVLFEAAKNKNKELGTLWDDLQKVDNQILKASHSNTIKRLQKKSLEIEKKMEEYGILVVDSKDIQQVVTQWKKTSTKRTKKTSNKKTSK